MRDRAANDAPAGDRPTGGPGEQAAGQPAGHRAEPPGMCPDTGPGEPPGARPGERLGERPGGCPDGRLSERLGEFVRYLRASEMVCDPAAVIDLHRLAAAGYVLQRQAFRDASRACLCRRQADWYRFDALFNAFWYSADWPDTGADDRPVPAADRQTGQSGQRLLGFGGSSEMQAQTGIAVGAGDFRALSLADFRFVFDPVEKQQVERLVERLARRARRQYQRRHRPADRGTRLDLRRTLGRQAVTGSTEAALRWQRPRRRLPKLVLLLDISQSMDIYTRVFLRFTCALLGVFDQSEAFAFNTSLFRLGRGSRRLQERDLEQVLNDAGKGWLGGTRIAASLYEFNRDYRPGSVNHRTTVVIFSDGCDTAPPGQALAELAAIQRSARRLVWVNPLLGRFAPGEPDRHMDPLRPCIDAYCSAHSVASLDTLAETLLRQTR